MQKVLASAFLLKKTQAGVAYAVLFLLVTEELPQRNGGSCPQFMCACSEARFWGVSGWYAALASLCKLDFGRANTSTSARCVPRIVEAKLSSGSEAGNSGLPQASVGLLEPSSVCLPASLRHIPRVTKPSAVYCTKNSLHYYDFSGIIVEYLMLAEGVFAH